MAHRGPQQALRSTGASDGGALYGVLALLQAHDAADDGREVGGAMAWGDPPPLGTGDDTGGRGAWRGGLALWASARGGPP
jgi:hypothetical protein